MPKQSTALCKHCGQKPYVMQHSSRHWSACCTIGCENRNGKNTQSGSTRDDVLSKWNKANDKEAAQ